MFGFSFWKLLLLVAVIFVAWFGWRWYQRWEIEQRRDETAKRTGGGAAPRLSAEDMVACRVCGMYVAKSARACARAECPFPR